MIKQEKLPQGTYGSQHQKHNDPIYFLRWHYPDQVNGSDTNTVSISAGLPQHPFWFDYIHESTMKNKNVKKFPQKIASRFKSPPRYV